MILVSPLMAAKPKIGDAGPDFTAKGIDGKQYNLKELAKAKVIVLTFTCNHCPVAAGYEKRFQSFADKFKKKGVEFVALNVTDETLDDMKKHAKKSGLKYPYASDPSQKSGKAYGARVTPHCFVLDHNRKIRYIGAFDDNWEADELVKDRFVEEAVTQILAGKKVAIPTSRAKGCGIQYRR